MIGLQILSMEHLPAANPDVLTDAFVKRLRLEDFYDLP